MSVMTDVEEMIDIALHAPEIGFVNLRVLHALLHVICRRLQIMDQKVEIRGTEAAALVSHPAPSLRLTEYVLEGKKGSEEQLLSDKIKEKIAITEEKKEQALRIIGQRADSKEEPAIEPKAIDKQEDSSLIKIVENEEVVIVVERFEDGTQDYGRGGKRKMSRGDQPTSKKGDKKPGKGRDAAGSSTTGSQADSKRISVVSQEEFSKLNDKVDKMLGDIEDDDLLAEVRSRTTSKSLTDIWRSLNVSSRLTALEKAVEKLSSLLNKLAQEYSGVKEILSGSVLQFHPDSNLQVGGDKVKSNSKGRVIEDGAGGGSGASVGRTDSAGAGRTGRDGIDGNLTDIENVLGPDAGNARRMSLGLLREDVNRLIDQMNKILGEGDGGEDVAGGGVVPCPDMIKHLNILKLKLEEIVARVALLENRMVERFSDIEGKIYDHSAQMSGLDTVFNNQMNNFQDQISDLERDITELNMKIEGQDDVDETNALPFKELSLKLQALQEELEIVNTATLRLAEDKEERQMHINALLEQIELLKTVKADREELEDALADKADQRLLNRKVSHDQFDAACDDLGRGLEETLAKLTMQETIWQQALDDIQREIDNKLDKMELSPLREFFNTKMRSLQERLKAIASMRRDAEAAGAKAKYLRNLNCLSCDQGVIMSTTEDIPCVPQMKPMPPSRSIKPYLSYELDNVRRQQKVLPTQRNLRDWENIQKDQRPPATAPPNLSRFDHLCNRYCGGSHTVTTATQRVARMGHFMKQWGPEVMGLSSPQALRGNDGRFYKGADAPDYISRQSKGDGRGDIPEKPETDRN